MSYGDFEITTVRDRFGLLLNADVDVFPNVPEIAPSDVLRLHLDRWLQIAILTNTEKARSEMIIAPILMEAAEFTDMRWKLFSGVAFDIDRDRGLNGTCDFLISCSSDVFAVSRPVVAVVEGKREDLVGGMGQCLAAMVAAQLFNQRDSTLRQTPIFGIVTTGTLWQFLRLELTQATIDRHEYHVERLPKILGILSHIAALTDPH